MTREARTLWWISQGILIFLTIWFYWPDQSLFPINCGLLGLHMAGAFYSQFIQDED